MDSNPPPSSSRRPRTGSQLQASALASAPAGTSRPTSRLQLDPATPAESDGSGGEYFDTLSTAPSQRSRLSTASFSRLPSAGGVSEGNGMTTTAIERSRRPSIRIRRSSVGLTGQQQAVTNVQDAAPDAQLQNRHESFRGNRPRSVSQPGPAPPAGGDVLSRTRNSRQPPPQITLARLTEEGSRPTMAELGLAPAGTSPLSPSASMPVAAGLERSHSMGEMGADETEIVRPARRSLVGRIFRPGLRRSSVVPPAPQQDAGARHEDEYNEELVDWLDIIDPEVQTLSTLTNVQNSLFIPDLGSWVNRRPTYVLSQPDALLTRPASSRDPIPPSEEPTIEEEPEREEGEDDDGQRPEKEDDVAPTPHIRRADTITSQISNSHYAALPHGKSLEGWTAAEKWEMDDHVRHMLHSRRSKFKRQMKGFGQYVRRPLGFFVTLYATLITLFGLAWVLFLIGWIYVGEEQVYAIHIIDSVLVALFAIMGDGLAPFRAIDTYHMIFIARYARIIAKARKKAAKASKQSESGANGKNKDTSASEKQNETSTAAETQAVSERPIQQRNTYVIPPIAVDNETNLDGSNNNDGNNKSRNSSSNGFNPGLDPDLEDAKSVMTDCSLEADYLTSKQRKSLEHHQKKLSKSHSFYKPHETFTHHAFPLGHLMAIIILLDCHSCLQISLGATTWGIDYHHRPFAITTVILCVSITCNLTAGLVIMFGDRKTRKKDVVDLLQRQALTGDAIKKVEKKKKKQDQEADGEGVLTGKSIADN
ncbi:hypothetical protein QQS21_006266 [Conoideocrella luteorostrata]|uniref:Integral membrane protein n=1 Tax=Conoideocrella luteorostrata TaxID=1105319 RepID=A0AAJ0CQM8_9HYPO|nr:hypothetical protein QQS21_006266 [Conoideocrella luteorostrata]